MATLTSLYPFIRMYAKQVPEETMDRAIRHAAREFSRKTWYERETITITEEAEVGFYDLEPSNTADTEILGVVAVEREDHGPLTPVTQEQVKQQEGEPWAWIFLPPTTLELINTPTATQTTYYDLYIRVALMPTLACTTLPDGMMRRYEQSIGYGAISFLTSMPNELWTNDKVAMMADDRFNEGMRTGKSEATFGHQPWNNQVQFRNFNI